MEENAKFMCNMFQSKKPFLIGRNGTIELQVLVKYLYNIQISHAEKTQLELNAGIFPRESIKDFLETYIESLKSVDAMAEGWYAPLK
jgi:hypothetical protein